MFQEATRRQGLLLGLAFSVTVVMLLILALSLPLAATAQEADGSLQQHVVVPGETLYGIAARYGVSAQAIAAANGISNLDLIRSGSRLIIPALEGQTGRTHIVQRGEALSQIAQLYGVPLGDLVLANNLPNPNYVFVGQRLLIPVVQPPPQQTPTPEPEPQVPTTPTLELPTGCSAGCEKISIMEPTEGLTVTSPVRVTGSGSAFEQTLVVKVLDATGAEIGLGYALISGTYGLQGIYSATVPYSVPTSTQPGRIQVYSVSPRDGAIEHLASTVVTLEGARLDEAILQLQAALVDKDYGALQALAVDPWLLGFYQSEALLLEPAAAVEQLRLNYLEPGQVVVDLSVDARALLGDSVQLSPDVSHVVFSSGWGPDQADDAFLLMVVDDEGRTRWGGMLYVFDALRDY